MYITPSSECNSNIDAHASLFCISSQLLLKTKHFSLSIQQKLAKSVEVRLAASVIARVRAVDDFRWVIVSFISKVRSRGHFGPPLGGICLLYEGNYKPCCAATRDLLSRPFALLTTLARPANRTHPTSNSFPKP